MPVKTSWMVGTGLLSLLALLGTAARQPATTGPAASENSGAVAKTQAHCMFVPQRLDDFAWENDRVAFRAYGPALEKQDGKQSGIDIWVKRTPAMVQEGWYKKGDYHNDNGEGLDGYKVGSSRGCGGTGILVNGKLATSGNFTAHRIVTNGPDKVVFELDYGPWDAGGTSVKETKQITLTAGSDLNEIRSTFTFDGPPLTVAVGLKLHEKGETLDVGNGAIATWEPLDGNDNGSIGCAVVMAGAGRPMKVGGDLCLTRQAKSGEAVTYRAGGGWSKAGYADAESWKGHLSATEMPASSKP